MKNARTTAFVTTCLILNSWVVDPYRTITFTPLFTTYHVSKLWQKLWFYHYSKKRNARDITSKKFFATSCSCGKLWGVEQKWKIYNFTTHNLLREQVMKKVAMKIVFVNITPRKMLLLTTVFCFFFFFFNEKPKPTW